MKLNKVLRIYASGRKIAEMKNGNVALNLSVKESVANAVKAFVAGNPRKGRRNVSELTEQLWISYLRAKGAKLPPLLKGSR